MTQEQFINVANLTKLRNAYGILNDVVVGKLGSKTEAKPRESLATAQAILLDLMEYLANKIDVTDIDRNLTHPATEESE